jgi:hypothetical protein
MIKTKIQCQAITGNELLTDKKLQCQKMHTNDKYCGTHVHAMNKQDDLDSFIDQNEYKVGIFLSSETREGVVTKDNIKHFHSVYGFNSEDLAIACEIQNYTVISLIFDNSSVNIKKSFYYQCKQGVFSDVIRFFIIKMVHNESFTINKNGSGKFYKNGMRSIDTNLEKKNFRNIIKPLFTFLKLTTLTNVLNIIDQLAKDLRIIDKRQIAEIVLPILSKCGDNKYSSELCINFMIYFNIIDRQSLFIALRTCQLCLYNKYPRAVDRHKRIFTEWQKSSLNPRNKSLVAITINNLMDYISNVKEILENPTLLEIILYTQ